MWDPDMSVDLIWTVNDNSDDDDEKQWRALRGFG